VPLPLGPDTGIANSARPEVGVVSMFPNTNQPLCNGDPSLSVNSRFRSAILNALLVTSELLVTMKAMTNATIAPEIHVASQMLSANFQFLRNQFRFGSGWVSSVFIGVSVILYKHS
jgi:hypothetical protein